MVGTVKRGGEEPNMREFLWRKEAEHFSHAHVA
jgi:hypothetical protein